MRILQLIRLSITHKKIIHIHQKTNITTDLNKNHDFYLGQKFIGMMNFFKYFYFFHNVFIAFYKKFTQIKNSNIILILSISLPVQERRRWKRMSKLINTYNNLKKQNSKIIYLFKNGTFYLALEDDAKLLSKEFNLKLINLNAETVKCGFPCSSFDKYYLMLKNLNQEFKIVDKDTISDATTYLKNKEILNVINTIKEIDINSLSVSKAFAFIEKLKELVDNIN